MISALMMLAAMTAPADARPEPPKCPVILVVATGDEAGFKGFEVSVDGATDPVSFHWSLSSGSIVQGQDTAAIKVEDEAGNNVTATVEVGGLPGECNAMASETAVIG